MTLWHTIGLIWVVMDCYGRKPKFADVCCLNPSLGSVVPLFYNRFGIRLGTLLRLLKVRLGIHHVRYLGLLCWCFSRLNDGILSFTDTFASRHLCGKLWIVVWCWASVVSSLLGVVGSMAQKLRHGLV